MTLIQSYVAGRFFVSTVYRRSSAAISSPPWYYETITWEKVGANWQAKMLDCVGHMLGSSGAAGEHAKICAALLKTIDVHEMEKAEEAAREARDD